MPALSFSGEPERGTFYELILSGEKTQTVRAPRKYPIKTGQLLTLYWKQRMAKDKKPIHFIGKALCIQVEKLPYRAFKDSESFARRDGFADEDELRDWFGWDLPEDTMFSVIHFRLITNCYGCDWCRTLGGQYVCGQGTYRYGIVEPFRDHPSGMGCYELTQVKHKVRSEK